MGLTNCSERTRYKYETKGLKPGHDNLILQLSDLPRSGVVWLYLPFDPTWLPLNCSIGEKLSKTKKTLVGPDHIRHAHYGLKSNHTSVRLPTGE